MIKKKTRCVQYIIHCIYYHIYCNAILFIPISMLSFPQFFKVSCELELEDKIVSLRKDNGNLRQKLQDKEKEIERLKLVISNLKGTV